MGTRGSRMTLGGGGLRSCLHRIPILYSLCIDLQGSQPLWKSGKPLKMSFQHFSQGKLREFGENTKKSGKTQGICDSDPEGKGFCQFGVSASCDMCPSCVH